MLNKYKKHTNLIQIKKKTKAIIISKTFPCENLLQWSWNHNFRIKTHHHTSKCAAKSKAYGEARNQSDHISEIRKGENNHFTESTVQKVALAVCGDQAKARRCWGGSTASTSTSPPPASQFWTPENS